MQLVHTCGPNEAMVVSGLFYSKPSYIVSGGRIFAIPYLHLVQRIPLNTITLEVVSPRVYTKKGVPISVTGIAQIKIESRKKETLSIACRLFLGKNEEQIKQIALETLEGHQRAIMGLMTIEEIYQDRKKFSEKVFEVAKCDLINMGISVVSYTIKDIRDEHGYLKALGMKRTAEVKRDARIGEAEAKRDKIQKQMMADEECQTAKLRNAIDIAMSKRDYEIKQAEFDYLVNENKARADLAHQLQTAKTKQSLMEENMQVQTVEKIAAINVAKEEVKRKENELNATVRQPAEAERYRIEKMAAAEKQKIILEAEAKAEADKLEGEAKAHVILMKGQADADQIQKKAEAYKKFESAAMAEMLLDMLPKLADKVGDSLYEGVDSIKMISTGGNEVGAAKLSKEMMNIVEHIPSSVSSIAGVDISAALKKQ